MLVVAVTLTYRFCIWKDHPLALAILGRRCTAKPLAVQLTRPLLVLFRARERYIYTPLLLFFLFFRLVFETCCMPRCAVWRPATTYANIVRGTCRKKQWSRWVQVVVEGRRTCEESVGWAESMTALSLTVCFFNHKPVCARNSHCK